jgi:hypothetical protein
MCSFRLKYPACNAHAPYCQLCLAPLCSVFPHYLTNCTICNKKHLFYIKCEFLSSKPIFSEIFPIPAKAQSDITTNALRSSCRVLIVLWDFNAIWILWTDFEDYWNTCIGSGVVPCRRTDGPSDMTKLIVALRNYAIEHKNPCSVPKHDQVSRLYMDLYSAAWSVCAETDSIQLTAVTATDTKPHSQ